MGSDKTSNQLDAIFSALGNNHRRKMIHILAYRPATISQLASETGLSLPAIHKHIKVLDEAGLISRRKSGRSNFVALSSETLGLAKGWIGRYQTHWGSRQESLENYIASLPD